MTARRGVCIWSFSEWGAAEGVEQDRCASGRGTLQACGLGWTELPRPWQAMHTAASWLRPGTPKAQAAEQSSGATETLVAAVAAPPAGSWAGRGFYGCRFSFQRTQMEFLMGTLGLGSEPGRAAWLAGVGGTLTGLRRGCARAEKQGSPRSTEAGVLGPREAHVHWPLPLGGSPH